MERVLRSNVTTTHNGAIPEVLPSSLLLRTSALPTLLSQTTTAVGVTLLALISTSPCLCSSISRSTVPELSPSFIAGKIPYLSLSVTVFFLCPISVCFLVGSFIYCFCHFHLGRRNNNLPKCTSRMLFLFYPINICYCTKYTVVTIGL